MKVLPHLKNMNTGLITDSAKIISCSFLSAVAGELLAYFLVDCWHDQISAVILGLITYLCLQALALFRYIR